MRQKLSLDLPPRQFLTVSQVELLLQLGHLELVQLLRVFFYQSLHGHLGVGVGQHRRLVRLGDAGDGEVSLVGALRRAFQLLHCYGRRLVDFRASVGVSSLLKGFLAFRGFEAFQVLDKTLHVLLERGLRFRGIGVPHRAKLLAMHIGWRLLGDLLNDVGSKLDLSDFGLVAIGMDIEKLLAISMVVRHDSKHRKVAKVCQISWLNTYKPIIKL